MDRIPTPQRTTVPQTENKIATRGKAKETVTIKSQKLEEFVLLGQTGYSKEVLERQVETLCHSTAFDNQDNARKLLRYLAAKTIQGKVAGPNDIAVNVFGKKYFYVGDDSQVRGETAKLRELIRKHYDSAEAQPEEIPFLIPERQYFVLATKAPSADVQTTVGETINISACIVEPTSNVEVFHRVTVRGRIDRLHLDLRAWLVVRTPSGQLYPQCRVTRNTPLWECEVRVGPVQSGSDEGAQYEIHLVAADGDGDAAFYEFLKSGRERFGLLLPTDCRVLDSKLIIRRDIRSGLEKSNLTRDMQN